jgi:peroxiredoxin
MPIQKGQTAPDFTLHTDQMEPWTLSEQRGDSVLLLFFPGAFTSVCTTELNEVNNDLQRYESAGTKVVGISTDSPFALAEFRKAQGLSFPLLSDHDGEVSEAYGAKYDGDFTPMKLSRISKRSAFLIGTDGEVKYAEVLENAGEMPNFDAITAAMAS